MSRIPDMCTLIIDVSHLGEKEKQETQVQITMPRPEYDFHYYLCFQVANGVDTTGLQHIVNNSILLFLFPMLL